MPSRPARTAPLLVAALAAPVSPACRDAPPTAPPDAAVTLGEAPATDAVRPIVLAARLPVEPANTPSAR